MLHSIEMGWFVLSKYYGLSDATPAYAAAILLHPSKRILYINKHWDRLWKTPAIEAVKKLWIDKYECFNTEQSLPESHQMSLLKERTVFQELEESSKVVGGNNGETFDDFLRFINDQPIDIGEDSQGHSIKPLNWWCYYEQRRRYPRLSRMAIDIFSIT